MSQPQFCLASRSPRRSELLGGAGFAFVTDAADIDEAVRPGEHPQDFVRRMAREKAARVAARHAGAVLAADTDVAIDGEMLGKPADRAHGIALLRRLSGRAHQVSSAVALHIGTQCEVVTTVTDVWFGEVSADDAARYWDSGEPCDKAGGYAVQGLGARWVREIRGSYTGVVGLPLYETCALLARHGIHPVAHR